jgi:hypothetical protein
MGHNWTQAELEEAFQAIDHLEFLADIPPKPTWVPCCIRTIDLNRGGVSLVLAFFDSPYSMALYWTYRANEVSIQGLDQIKNRLRPKVREEASHE